MSTATRFRTFLTNIQLTESQTADAITKHNTIAEILAEKYYGAKSEASSNKLLVGSYGKRTAIRPPNDIDMIFYLPTEVYNRFNQLTGWGRNKQSELLQEIKRTLESKYTNTSMSGDGQVVVVDFYSIKVEVAPAFRVNDDSTFIPDTNNGGMWKKIFPQNELQRLIDANKESNGHVIRLIKMIKRWKNYCNVPIKSLIIEIMAIGYIKTYAYKDKDEIYYDFMIRDFFKYLVPYGTGTYEYTYPETGEKIKLGDEWTSKAKTALDNAIAACQFEIGENKDESKATALWKKIFGDDFQY